MRLDLPNNISSRRVSLRPLKENDMQAFVSFMTDSSATKYLLFEEEQKTVKGAHDLLDLVIMSYETDEQIYSLAIADRDSDAFIGSNGLSPMPETENAYQIYWSIMPELWGRGLGTESTILLIEYTFNVLKIEQIVAYTHPENIGSQHVAEKSGFRNKGLVEHPFTKQKAMFYEINNKEIR